MEIVDLSTLPDAETRYTEFLKQICDKHEMDHAAYAGMNPAAGTVAGFVTYDDAWNEHYQNQGLIMIDPTIHMARRSIAPVDWSRLERSPEFQRVFRDAHDFGIPNQGVTIPDPRALRRYWIAQRDPRMFSKEEWRKLYTHVISDLQSMAVHIHDHVVMPQMN